MIPIVAGLLMGAAMGGGIAALQKKDILQGALMGGIGGAVGGAFMPGATGAVAGETVGSAVGSGIAPATTTGTSGIFAPSAGITAGGQPLISSGLGYGATSTVPGQVMVNGSPLISNIGQTAASAAAPAAGSGGIGSFLGANKYALAGGVAGGMMAPSKEPEPADQGNIYTTQFLQEKNPNFGAPGENYFSSQPYAPGTYTAAKDYNPTQMAANGGIIALAEGGGVETQRYSQPVRTIAPEVEAYNNRMMERANQQYNVNAPPSSMLVPGSQDDVKRQAEQAARNAAKAQETPLDFIDQQYKNYYGRLADPAGRALVQQQLDAGMSQDKLMEIMAMQPEHTAYVAANPKAVKPQGVTYNPVTRTYEGNALTQDMRDAKPLSMMQDQQLYSGNNGGDFANGGLMNSYARGGISNLGGYSDGGQLLKGPGDGVSDDIPAKIGNKQPARLADGEFVVPARIVSELGNGSTDAGAKRLYAMMDRVQSNRKKSIGKGKVAVDSKSRKLLPA